MAKYKKTHRHGRSKRQKRRTLKRNNRKSKKVMRGGKTENEKPRSTKSFMMRIKDLFGPPESQKSNPKEQSKTSEIRIIGSKELTNPDGSPFRFDDPKPLERYGVLVEYHLRDFSVMEPIAKRDGTFDIYGYKIVGDHIRLDGTLNIPEFKEAGKFNRLKFSFFMRDGEMYIQPENMLTTPDGKQVITRIVVKSPEYSTDLITPPPVPDLFKKILDDKEKEDEAKETAERLNPLDAEEKEAEAKETAERLKKLYAEEKEDSLYWDRYEKSKAAGFKSQNHEEHARMMLRQYDRNKKIKQLNTYGARVVELLERDETNRLKMEKKAALKAYYERHPDELPVVDDV